MEDRAQWKNTVENSDRKSARVVIFQNVLDRNLRLISPRQKGLLHPYAAWAVIKKRRRPQNHHLVG